MINVGLIGVGGIAGAHLPAYATLDSAQVVALCDKDPVRARGEGREIPLNIPTGGGTAVQAKAYLDYRELVADAEVEAVDICLPTDLHADVAVAALEAGKHVLCEKPMALTVAECDRMIAAAAQSGRMLMVAHCVRFWPEYLALKAEIASGNLGELLSAGFTRIGGMPAWSYENWFADPARSGGAILDLHVHDADFVRYLFGTPQSVSSLGVENGNGITHVLTDYRYADGKKVYAEGGWFLSTQFPFQMTFMVRCERGGIVMDGARGPLTVYPDAGEAYQPALPECDGYRNEIRYFLECVANGVQPEIVTAFDARETIRMIHAEMASVRSGAPVAL